jgi:hypothetical protein
MFILQKVDTLFLLHKLCFLAEGVTVISEESELQGARQEW